MSNEADKILEESFSDPKLQWLKERAEESHCRKGARRFTMADSEYSRALIQKWFFASAEERYQENKRLRESEDG